MEPGAVYLLHPMPNAGSNPVFVPNPYVDWLIHSCGSSIPPHAPRIRDWVQSQCDILNYEGFSDSMPDPDCFQDQDSVTDNDFPRPASNSVAGDSTIPAWVVYHRQLASRLKQQWEEAPPRKETDFDKTGWVCQKMKFKDGSEGVAYFRQPPTSYFPDVANYSLLIRMKSVPQPPLPPKSSIKLDDGSFGDQQRKSLQQCLQDKAANMDLKLPIPRSKYSSLKQLPIQKQDSDGPPSRESYVLMRSTADHSMQGIMQLENLGKRRHMMTSDQTLGRDIKRSQLQRPSESNLASADKLPVKPKKSQRSGVISFLNGRHDIDIPTATAKTRDETERVLQADRLVCTESSRTDHRLHISAGKLPADNINDHRHYDSQG
jgi:hypothetical protein